LGSAAVESRTEAVGPFGAIERCPLHGARLVVLS
jgi:hypothetical protein